MVCAVPLQKTRALAVPALPQRRQPYTDVVFQRGERGHRPFTACELRCHPMPTLNIKKQDCTRVVRSAESMIAVVLAS